MKQQQWLNVIIIVISALILAFVLLGRFLDPDKNKIEDVSAPLELRLIDFGTQRLTYEPQNKAAGELLGWSVYPQSSLSTDEIKSLVDSWQELLSMPLQQDDIKQDKRISGVTVLLFFTGTELPLVTKVSIRNSEARDAEIIIDFIAEKRTVVVKNLSKYQFLPKQSNNESFNDKN